MSLSVGSLRGAISMSSPDTTANDLALLLRARFGDSVGVSSCVIHDGCALFPEEEIYIRSAAARRREEFSTGRWCARQALLNLGVPPAPILVGRWREPLWPAEMIGSITHATSLCAAVVAPSGLWQGIGIDVLDAQVAGRLLRDADGLIARGEEEHSARAVAPAGVDPRALLFSAKESAIKAISGRFQRFIDFTEIRVRFEGDRFEAHCGPAGIPVTGWWNATNEQILTGSVLYRTDECVGVGI